MPPSFSERAARLLRHDTSNMRLVASVGLFLIGVALLIVDTDEDGYTLLRSLAPLSWWGFVYATAGFFGVVGAFFRIPYWYRVGLTCTKMYLWSYMALTHIVTPPFTPLEPLLLLPALIEVWVLIKIVVSGPRRDQ